MKYAKRACRCTNVLVVAESEAAEVDLPAADLPT
jgi:hypothetical protein